MASVPWSPAAWTTNSNYQTPNLTGIVQELVNRPGWASGNALVMLATAPGSSCGNRAAKHNNGFRPERMGHGIDNLTGTKIR